MKHRVIEFACVLAALRHEMLVNKIPRAHSDNPPDPYYKAGAIFFSGYPVGVFAQAQME